MLELNDYFKVYQQKWIIWYYVALHVVRRNTSCSTTSILTWYPETVSIYFQYSCPSNSVPSWSTDKSPLKSRKNLRQIDHGMTTSIIYQHGQTFWTSVAPLRFGWNRTGLSSYVLEREYIFRLLVHWSISFLQFIVSYIVQQMVHHCSMGYVALKSQMELQ